MTQIEDMEKELAGLVAVRERSVGVDLKRVNYRIATLQSRLRNVEKDAALAAELSSQRDAPARDFEEVATELGI